ncbi:MAG TPA: archaetidylserine decarboxylase [Steroidobacteraceae bacterium]|jgi:phosphatidylserine decarboxylase|nr:archaetidylserine decarboxylase [Steroidobacteraceae bacterium]
MTGGDEDSASARAFVALQYLLPHHLLSSLAYEITRSRVRWVKNALIGAFVRRFQPDMSDAAQPDPFAFESFNAFFTRALRADARPVAADRAAIVSPVDGTVSQLGRLDGSWLMQAKGYAYTLESLLATEGSWAEPFRGGAFATLYLAPFNYHRIHMPLEGTLRAAWYIPGQLFSVNATTAASVPGLFARNERVVCVFGAGGLSFALVLIGALFVGSMSTVWHGEVTPRRPRRRAELRLDASVASLTLGRTAEVGRFNMGSTVILLLPPGTAQWRATLAAGSTVRVGEAIATLT